MADNTVVLTQRLFPLLEHLARAGRREFEATLAPGALRRRHVVALNLLQTRGPIGQQGLAEALSLDPSNVVGLLNELEERRLVTRRRDPADRRRHIVELSAEGLAELDRMGTRLDGVEDNLLGALTAEERATLYDLLSRAAGLSPACDTDEPDTARPSPCDEPD